MQYAESGSFAVAGTKVAAASQSVPAVARIGRAAVIVVNRSLRDAVREVLEHVEASDALLGEERRGAGLRLLQNGRDQIADLRLLALRALDVQHRRLQRAAKRRRLLGLALLSARQGLDGFVQAVADRAAEQRHIGAARRQNTLSVGIVGDGVQQVFEREIGVAARHRLAERDMENHFDGSRKHQASSMVARNG